MSLTHSHSDSNDSKASKASTTSETSNPSQTSEVTTPTPSPDSNNLDDIFGDPDPNSISSLSAAQTVETSYTTQQHPSDIARLRGIHVTAGYREGIAQARSAAVQGGFDEGWILGAAIGVRIGVLVGVVEGLVAAFQAVDADDLRSEGKADKDTGDKLASVQQRARALLTCIRRDLQAENVFGEQFISLDGTWKWHVSTEEMERGGMDCVAEAHPLIRKYAAVVGRWVRALGLQREGGRDDDRGHGG